MKKFLSALLAAAMTVSMAGSLTIPAFAAVNTTRDIGTLSGNPIDQDGKAITGDTIAPGQTIYYLLPGDAGRILNNTRDFKISTKKSKNAKLVKSVSLTERKLTTSGSYVVPSGFAVGDTMDNNYVATAAETTNTISASARNVYLAVVLNDTTTTDEIKVEFTTTFTARRNPASTGAFDFRYGAGTTTPNTTPVPAATSNPKFLGTAPLAASNDKLTFRFSFFVANPSDTGDAGVTVGTNGVSIKPVKNEENEITFESSSGDSIAVLSFMASSNPDKFYAKLSTKWTSDLLAKFKNTDAVIRKFTPATISSTSRATLALVNPYDSEDVSPNKVYIYSVSSSGVISDITKQSTTRYNSDDDTFEIKTRSLGTYIISNQKIKI